MKLNLPAVVPWFAAYHAGNPTWGALHLVLADGNVRNDDALYCWHEAELHGDREGARLAKILLRLSKTQRKKLTHAVSEHERSQVN